MRNEGLTKTYYAAGAIAANTIVKLGAADNSIANAVAATDAIIGVCDNLGADAANHPVDIIMDGIATVKAGGVITRGAPVTANASGQAVASSAAAGARILGFALASAASGDLFPVRIAPGFNNA